MRKPKSPAAARSAGRSAAKITPCCSNEGMKRGPWTLEEDQLLSSCITREGEGRWRTLPKRAGLLRCGKSCRLRWMNYLRPSVKRGHISPDEEDLILRLHRLLGNRWSLIAGRIPGRTDNEIKNYWNTHLSKKLISQEIDPRTHKPLMPKSSPDCSPCVATPVSIAQKPNSSSPTVRELDGSGEHGNGVKGIHEDTGRWFLEESDRFHIYGGGGNEISQDSAGMELAATMGFQDNWGIQGGNGDSTDYCIGEVASSFLDSLLDEDMFLKQRQICSAASDQGSQIGEFADRNAAAIPSPTGGDVEISCQSGAHASGCL